MANHRRPSKKRLAPTIVLALSVASITSPLALLFNTEKLHRETAPVEFIPPVLDQAGATTTAVLAKAKRVAPIYTAVPAPVRTEAEAPRAATKTSTAQAQPTRQRATQRATGSSLPPVQHPPTSTRPAQPTLPAPPSTAVKAAPKAKPPPPTTTQKATSPPPKPPPPKPPPPKPPPPKPTPTPTKTIEKTTDPPKALSPPPPPPPTHQLLAQIAQKYMGRGIPYQMGGNSLSSGMDCSHFVWMVLKEAGYNVQYRDSAGLASWTTRTTSPQPGDLVLFSGHVGIFVGNGQMIDQGSSGGAHLREFKYYHNFIGYGRLPI